MSFEDRARLVVFDYLRRQLEVAGGHALTLDVLTRGVEVEGRRVTLVGRVEGIWRPAGFAKPISVKSVFSGSGDAPYDEGFDDEQQVFRYAYRDARTDNERARTGARRTNESVRQAMREQTPIVFLFGVAKGAYVPFFPTYVVADDRTARMFSLELNEAWATSAQALPSLAAEATPARAYKARIVQTRVHQERFRHLVLAAYRHCCAVCRLQHERLLDASQIRSDADAGEPVVSNGLALCKLHHAAYDSDVLGIRPDLTVEIRREILEVRDGPLHEHGLLDFHGQRLLVIPRRRDHRPDPDALAARYERFRAA